MNLCPKLEKNQNYYLYILSSYCFFLSSLWKNGSHFLTPFLYLLFTLEIAIVSFLCLILFPETPLAKMTKFANCKGWSFFLVFTFSLLICGIWHYCLLSFSNSLPVLFSFLWIRHSQLPFCCCCCFLLHFLNVGDTLDSALGLFSFFYIFPRWPHLFLVEHLTIISIVTNPKSSSLIRTLHFRLLSMASKHPH